MKTLSIQQPWATLLAAGIKDVENRSWKTDHRGPLLIHASSTWGAHLDDPNLPLPVFREYYQITSDEDVQSVNLSILGVENGSTLVLLDEAYRREFDLLKAEIAAQLDHGITLFPSSAIVGQTNLVDIVTDSQSPWAAPESYHWLFKDTNLFLNPIKEVKGKLRFWDYDGTLDSTPRFSL